MVNLVLFGARWHPDLQLHIEILGPDDEERDFILDNLNEEGVCVDHLEVVEDEEADHPYAHSRKYTDN